MKEAAARREALLQRRSEQAGFHANRARQKGEGRGGGDRDTPTKRDLNDAFLGSAETAKAEEPPPAQDCGVLDVCRFNPALRLFFNLFNRGRKIILALLSNIFKVQQSK